MTAQHVEPVRTPGAGFGQIAGRYAYRALILFVLAANILVAAYIVAVVVPALIRVETGQPGLPPPPVVTSSPTPTPTPTPGVMAPIGVLMPVDADCSACHSAPGVTNPRPVMAHPLEGWQDCTSCHATDKLVATAPGHSSFHKGDCLVCHTARVDQSPAPRPHHSYNGTACTTCHGNAAIQQAPLPTDMAGRTNCWVCHGLTQGDELWNATTAPQPSATAGPRGTLPTFAP